MDRGKEKEKSERIAKKIRTSAVKVYSVLVQQSKR